MERGKTRGNRGSGRKEEREKLNEKEVGLAEGQVDFPRGHRSPVPDASRSLPDSAGRSSVKFRDGAGLGSSLNLPRPEYVLSGRAAAQISLLRVELTVKLVLVCSEGERRPRRDCGKGAENLKIEGSPPLGADSQSYIPRPFQNSVACTLLTPATPTSHPRRGSEKGSLGSPGLGSPPRTDSGNSLRSLPGHRSDYFNDLFSPVLCATSIIAPPLSCTTLGLISPQFGFQSHRVKTNPHRGGE